MEQTYSASSSDPVPVAVMSKDLDEDGLQKGRSTLSGSSNVQLFHQSDNVVVL